MATKKIGFQQDWYYGDEEEKGGVLDSSYTGEQYGPYKRNKGYIAGSCG